MLYITTVIFHRIFRLKVKGPFAIGVIYLGKWGGETLFSSLEEVVLQPEFEIPYWESIIWTETQNIQELEYQVL